MARRETVIVVAVVASLVSAAVVLFVMSAPSTFPPGAVPGIAAVVVIGVAVLITMMVLRRRRKPPQPAEAPAGLEWEKVLPADLHRSFGPLPGIPSSGSTTKVLRGEIDGRPLTIFEHSYVVHTGHATIPVRHVACVTGAPAWPAVTIAPRGAFGRLLRRLGLGRGLELEEEAFNAACHVRTDDEEFALMLLGPEMQRFLTANRGRTWHVRAGCCALIEPGALEPGRVGASVERLRQFWALVPPELIDWE